MIAIIPVAGAGTKLRPHTYTQPKSLIPIAGKPILSYSLDSLIEKGVEKFILVIGYLGDKIKDFVAQNYPAINVEYVYQEKREGLGHAVWLTKDYVKKGEEVVIVLGDSIIDADWDSFLNLPYSALAIRKVDDPGRFGVVELNGNEFIQRVVEKPLIPKSNLALVGLYKIKEFDLLIECLSHNIESGFKTQNEYQLTDALGLMIKKGTQIKSFKVENWFDCGQKEVLLSTNTIFLKKFGGNGGNKKFKNSIIINPVHIGDQVVIENSIVGPYVTIGDNSTVKNTIVGESIIGNFTTLQDISMNASIIGSDSLIKGSGHSLNIGDNTDLDLS